MVRVPGPDPGIIPAYAGSTHWAISATAAERDHPRIRGEHAKGDYANAIAGGSSPHTRGARRGA